MADKHYLVLARKWRPQSFEDVVGQEHITRALQNAIRSGRIGHAYLFIGSRGIGKTTTARILAKALNCLSSDKPTPEPCGACDNCTSIASGNNIDVMEIDGASNNSVDDVRQIREYIRLVPSASRYKIYVIDEVHQLSSSAFNALLKTLEEPPEHAVFILATTDAHKLPATIVSRCQRYDFRRVGISVVTVLLRRILDAEGVTCSDEALHAIARAADGGVRDAESILEQLISYCGNEITFEDVVNVLGLIDYQMLHDLCDAVLAKDIGKQLSIVEEVVVSGRDLTQFVLDIIMYYRNLLVCKEVAETDLLALPEEEIAALKTRAASFNRTELIKLVEQFAELSKNFDSQLAQRFALETLLIRLSKVGADLSVDTILDRLSQLGVGGVGHISDSGTTPSFPPRTASPASAPTKSAPRSEGNLAVRPEEALRDEEPVQPALRGGQITLTEDNIREAWPRITEQAGRHSLNLALYLANATPIALADGMLHMQFAASKEKARLFIESPENRAVVDDILRKETTNVRGFVTVTAQDAPKSETPVPAAPENVPFGGHATRDAALRALANPHIAQVVETFRGRIVDVRRSSTPAAPEE